MMRVAVQGVPLRLVALPRLKGKKVGARTVKAEETEVVRVAKDFATDQAWNAALRGFRGFVVERLTLTDAWGAAEERRLGEVIVGLGRVKQSQLGNVLGRSGIDGLFVEPMGKPTTTHGYGLTWVETRKDEAAEDYFK